VRAADAQRCCQIEWFIKQLMNSTYYFPLPTKPAADGATACFSSNLLPSA